MDEPIKQPKFMRQPEIVQRLTEMIKRGIPQSQAVKACNINQTTFDTWRRKGKKIAEAIDDEEEMEELLDPTNAGYLNVYRKVDQAICDCMNDNLTNIQKAGADHWQASAWILERRFHKFFGRTDKIKLDMTSAQTMLDLIIKDIIPFVPEDRHNELADKLKEIVVKLSEVTGDTEEI